MTVKKRAGLSSEKQVNRVPAGTASPNSTGRIRVILRPNTRWYQYVVARLDCIQISAGDWNHRRENLMDQDKEITREELHQLVWSKPTRIAAKEFDLSELTRTTPLALR